MCPACCPPNAARLFMSLGRYAWSTAGNTAFSHLYIGGRHQLELAGGITIDISTRYPWEGTVTYKVTPNVPNTRMTLAIRLPGWSRNTSIRINGEETGLGGLIRDGYAYLERDWCAGDVVELLLDMSVQRIYANTAVRADANCVALMRGPIVFCLEQKDNGPQLSALRLPRQESIRVKPIHEGVLEGMLMLEAEGIRLTSGQELYSDQPPSKNSARIRVIPYFAWGNRGEGEMRVWIQEK